MAGLCPGVVVMAKVYLGLGSNCERDRHIGAALDALADRFGTLHLSSVYESAAVGFAGEDFYNLVAGVETPLSVGELSCWLKQVEDENGRDRHAPKFSSRTLDIDILVYDQCAGVIEGVELPRAEILSSAFVLRPLAELAGQERHPALGMTYESLWRNYRSAQALRPVDFVWRNRRLPGVFG